MPKCRVELFVGFLKRIKARRAMGHRVGKFARQYPMLRAMPSPRGRPPADDMLTPTEWDVVEAVRHGLSNPEIARRRDVSVDAIKYHVANALNKLSFTSRRQLRTWTGIRKHSALAASPLPTMNSITTVGPIGQISRTVKDIVAATQWYRDVLGLQHLYSFGDLAFFNCGGLRLFLSERDGDAAESILYFRVDDIRVAHAGLLAKGVTFTNAPHLVHKHDDGVEEWMAFFNDNDGRPLALMSQVSPRVTSNKEGSS
jgi:DNA-binding CsgD family transcriptional regulator/catechol 2,3-dioxygenase-like lactoylglutathione lyase family enzyme